MISFFGKLFGTKKESIDPMKKFLIVGLGNIGPKYHNTRHNIGFKILDAYAAEKEETWSTEKLGDIAQLKVRGKTVILLKPNTYMNLSGKAVKYWMQKEKISMENILVITDDLNLDFGTIRVKTKGSDGGHNGLKDIQNQLLTTNYNRFRFGIGDRFSKGKQIDYVLGEWDSEEEKDMPERLDISCKVIESFIASGITNTMNAYNGK
ncbi:MULTISPECIES: aminoacyl-tRNA hydrolase [unclassified Leeuwenhoekiella]|uniref:aminoacyl-tRNA hydrolase n=1 Tax=unclassified Leeuwenhoekiella TaxID=2615029 RepID=UPI000C63A606|nr:MULTISPECIES: aminoacyl-tRNA hydrolase [unclassified Leeuwenhoekiella]MAW96215.1 aminoacyl-tRNA hydrolase [Leeuwenhoekiella sp.]MBA80209.1 aminoacyl-tRNA hydrolase [Leeuwenhoekiella sp.]|tara:strand:+ start:974 stop:1594 length:621 start_codon:yes stop_codon:yes gene_type:complete